MAEAEDVKKEENAEDVAGEQPEKKQPWSPKKKAVVISLIIFVILLIQAGSAYLLVALLKGKNPAVEAIKQQELEEQTRKAMMTRIGATLEEPITLTVNVAGSKGSHYLKCQVQFDWDDKEFPELRDKIAERRPKIQDIIIDILSTQSMEDLNKKSGKQRIRESIKSEVNMTIPEKLGKIQNVFLQEFIIQ
jgi:flagellar FliL protein